MSFSISDKAKKRLEELKKRYPKPQSAVMSALYIVQEEHGYISDEAIDWVAEEVGLAPVHVLELATFYTMYRTKPLGKYHVQVCRTLSCGMNGAKGLMEKMKERYDIMPGEVSPDGEFSYEYVECLGSCGSAPMCEINDTYFENLTPEKFEKILDSIEKEKPDLSLSTINGKLGSGLKGYTKSEVLQND